MAAKKGMAVTEQGQAAGDAALAALGMASECRDLPTDLIIVEDQIRSAYDTESESFLSFTGSVESVGVIQPIGVAPRGDKFVLLFGRWRFEATLKCGRKTIPARIFPDVRTREQILSIQLIENLHRKELNPVDKANGILTLFRVRHEGIELDQVLTVLLQYKVDPAKVDAGYRATVAIVVKIFGVSLGTLQNSLSLLKLPPEIQEALKAGTLPVSQGYIFAENLDNPGLMAVFEEVLRNPVTMETLKARLKAAAQAGEGEGQELPPVFRALYTSIRTTTDKLLSGKVRFDLIELENLHLQLMALDEVVLRAKAGGGTAAEPPEPPEPEKPPSKPGKKKIIA